MLLLSSLSQSQLEKVSNECAYLLLLAVVAASSSSLVYIPITCLAFLLPCLFFVDELGIEEEGREWYRFNYDL
jgi:hypothetical protein